MCVRVVCVCVWYYVRVCLVALVGWLVESTGPPKQEALFVHAVLLLQSQHVCGVVTWGQTLIPPSATRLNLMPGPHLQDSCRATLPQISESSVQGRQGPGRQQQHNQHPANPPQQSQPAQPESRRTAQGGPRAQRPRPRCKPPSHAVWARPQEGQKCLQ